MSKTKIEKRIREFHRTISEEEYKKLAEESMRCPVCCGRPLLHMRMCMRRREELQKLKKKAGWVV
jgi:uncharacterized protein with PIN domain